VRDNSFDVQQIRGLRRPRRAWISACAVSRRGEVRARRPAL